MNIAQLNIKEIIKNWMTVINKLSLILFTGMKQVLRAVIAVAVASFVGSSGADGQRVTQITLPLEQAADDYEYTSIFDKPIQHMSRKNAFDLFVEQHMKLQKKGFGHMSLESLCYWEKKLIQAFP